MAGRVVQIGARTGRAAVISDLVMAIFIRFELGSLAWPRYPWVAPAPEKVQQAAARITRASPGKEKVRK
jgi:hypothetical protein